MTHLGLFEGIGGFALAAQWAGWHTSTVVEWNPYCQAILKKNFPDATIYGDIKQFDGRPYAGQIDIITGGFPCQPFSHAGKREGATDDRYLWPEMLRIIRQIKPAWVVGENVAGLLTMDGGHIFAGILADLENAGYSTETYLIPAVSVGAPHRRDRIWIIAYNSGIGCGRWPYFKREEEAGRSRIIGENKRSITNTNKPGLEKRESKQGNNGTEQPTSFRNFWTEHWYEVATRLCRVDDGISGGVDGIGPIPAKAKKGKAHRLEALGNAIVPQIAYQIFEAINEFNDAQTNQPNNNPILAGTP